jgi:tetratricopeptide (TPR) repeat protein
MATASRRLTRKDLRQPDWFQITTEKALEYYAEHRTGVVAAGVGLVVLLLAVWGWQIFKQRQDTMASAQFGQAIALFQEGKHREAVAAFEKVEAYRWSHYAALAYLYQANSFLAVKDLDKAINAASLRRPSPIRCTGKSAWSLWPMQRSRSASAKSRWSLHGSRKISGLFGPPRSWAERAAPSN